MGIVNNMPSSGGLDINGIIEEYYVSGDKISAGDFVKFVENSLSISPKEKIVENLF